MTLGNVISEFRNINNLTMDEFAKMSGLSKSYISMLERNKDPRGNPINPSIEVIDKVANTIGVDVDELVRQLDQDVTINSSTRSQKNRSDWKLMDSFETITENKWKFIKYCYEHASKGDREQVLSILKVREKWEEYKEMRDLFTDQDE